MNDWECYHTFTQNYSCACWSLGSKSPSHWDHGLIIHSYIMVKAISYFSKTFDTPRVFTQLSHVQIHDDHIIMHFHYSRLWWNKSMRMWLQWLPLKLGCMISYKPHQYLCSSFGGSSVLLWSLWEHASDISMPIVTCEYKYRLYKYWKRQKLDGSSR